MIGRLVFFYLLPWLVLAGVVLVLQLGWWLLPVAAIFLIILVGGATASRPASTPSAPGRTRRNPPPMVDEACGLAVSATDLPSVYVPPPPRAAPPAVAAATSVIPGLGSYRLSWRVGRRPSEPLLPDGGDHEA